MVTNATLPSRAKRVLRSIRQAIPSGVVLGRKSPGEGPAEFVPFAEAVSSLLDGLSATRGAIVYRAASAWAALAAGTQGYVLKMGANDPAWGQVAADEVTYDNSSSGMTATDAQAAIDEVEGRVDTVEATYATAMLITGEDNGAGPEFISNGVGYPMLLR